MANRIKIDQEKGYYVVRPNFKQQAESKKVQNRVFREALDSGALLRDELQKSMRARKMWDDEKQAEVEKLTKILEDGEKKLRIGGIKKSEARQIALDMRRARFSQLSLLAETRELDIFTCESQSENAAHDYLVSVCTVDENGDPVYKDLDDYKERSSEPYSVSAAAKLANLIHGVKENWMADLPENKFLLQHGFCNEKLDLVNKDGELISADGRKINDKGLYIREDGKLEDSEGNIVDENGEVVIETQPFLDD